VTPDRPHAGRALLRVDWKPGSDRLEGTCHCGAVHLADGPAEVWDWLLGHCADHTASHFVGRTPPASRLPAVPTTGATRPNGVHA